MVDGGGAMNFKNLYQRPAILLAIVICLGASKDVQAQPLDEAIKSSHILAETQQFQKAITILDNVSDEDKTSYDYRFLRSRLLAWSGRYSMADKTFIALLSDYPNNPDIMVSYGYLKFFTGDLALAESYFNRVLAEHPTYLDAYEGLQRTYDMRKEQRRVSYQALDVAVSCAPGQVLTGDGACKAP